MAKVTIGLPVRNGADFLPASLDSLVGQTFEDFELIISDNCSTDETEEICRTFATRDSRVRYIRRDVNRGAAWNFNGLVAEATGPYFKWATHDDVLAPTCVERCVEVLDRAGEVVLTYPRTQIIDADGNKVRDYVDGVDLREHTPHERLRSLVQNLVLGNPIFGVVRRSVLARTRLNGGFPSSDYVLLAELALLGEIWQVPEVLFYRRWHEGMSRKANATLADVAEWFAPGSGRDTTREFTRLLIEHLRSIHAMPLRRAERIRCYTTFLDVWLRRNGVLVVGEISGLEYTGGRVPFRSRRRSQISR